MKTLLTIIAVAAILQGCAGANLRHIEANVQTYSLEKICANLRLDKDILSKKGPSGFMENIKQQQTKQIAELRRRDLFSEKDLTRITKGVVQIGMSEKALVCSWKAPMRVNESVGSYGVHKQYVYGTHRVCSGGMCMGGARQYVYVENGKVTSWQN